MTEKRFKYTITDGFFDGDVLISIKEVVDLLNEQQATINELKAKLKEKEEDERLYANEIVELRKTNEEWLQFKELGGDY